MRTNTVLRGVGVVVGLVLIAGAFVLAFFVTPTYVARLPGDTDVARSYTGSFKTLLDAQEVAKGNLLSAVKRDVPMAVERTVKVLDTSGDTALVSDVRTTTAAGRAVEKTTWQYAVDRKSLEPATDHPSDWTVVDAKGLTVSWPIGAKKQTYTGWRPETGTTTPLTYARTESRSGVSTYVYLARLPATRITDTQVLAGLPKAVPKSTLALVAQVGTVPAEAKAKLAALLPTLPDPVPLSYTLQSADTFWIEPETGIVVDTERAQQRTAGVVTPGDGAFLPLLPVSDVSYRQTPDSVQDAANDAKDGRNAISLLGTVLPIVLGVVGAVLVAVSLLVRRRGPRGGAAPTAPAAPNAPGAPGGPGGPAWPTPPTGPGTDS
ncbi:porin PorA family protein [Streptomyces sp. NRRL B-24484]|uniref:porin PorA family protein n=1 Tax=Streptomyces sp. NRRL B-24484 TaxID=1463833 RepID=UPI0004BF6E7B|nr:porin PorA family protein [Streptomyces sp. NRRL B-24484]